MTAYYPLEIEFEFNGLKQSIWPVILKDESDVILIDCGYPGFLPLLEDAALRHSIQLGTVTKIILTHDDMDHTGSAAALKRKYPHLEIYAFESEAPFIEGTKKSLRLAQAEATLNHLAGEERSSAEQFIRFLESIEHVPVDRTLNKDDILPWCGGVQVIHTPGHTPGHISLYLPSEQTLVAADAVVIEDGRLEIANPGYCLDLKEAVRSVQKLLDYEISQLICYHGGIFQGDVKKALQQLVRDYEERP